MNFVGKFDGKLHLDGSGAHPDAPQHVDSASPHAASDTIIVPDADLLFHGDFKRSGVDLIVSRDDHELVVQDYFKGEKRAALASPDGARLTADIINALAGHVEVAQADGSAGAGKVIGHVTKLVGTATAIRNGVSIILNQGDNVEKGDVVQSGSGSTLGVTFIDGTVFGLSSNARMVLNEMVYDPNGSDNSALISLVAGTISFVAGQTAKHGDMKVDTPVATMGIRGTAVLVEIDFDVPGQNGMPEAKFQVLVEPDGTTGSYILFDKSTLAPIAIVDKAGQRIDVSNNNVSISDSAFTPELQKLITDVFTLKFSATNPQTLTHFADTVTPQQTWLPVQLANNGPPQLVHLTITPIVSASGPSFSGPLPSPIPHLDVPPAVTTVDISSTERAGITGSSAIDTTSGTISFADVNLGDRPTATATFSSFSYQNAQHQSIAPTVQELADIQTLEQIPLVVVQAPGNTSNGTATWTLNVPDRDFDFLGAGDTLTLTYMAKVDSNYAAGNLVTLVPFTVTITGTNDAPVITTGPEKVAFINVGTSTTGPNLPPPTGPTTNTLAFKDPDLTDTHTVATDLTAATLSGTGISTLDMQALEAKFPRPMGVFESALSAAVTTDSSGTGTGTITWTLADISAYYADIVPAGETLTLTYTVTVKDSQGATSSQNVIVTITGSDAAAVVWVETTATAATDAAPGDWNGANNWETGTVPTASDDVIIITNQLQGQTPFYPVTIEAAGAAAFAHSLTMNDYGTLFTNSPTLINHNALTVGAGGISLSADAILENFGTLSVGGLAEFLQEASLQNSGLLKLQDGGDFNDSGSYTDSHGTIHSGSITNSGTIEVAGGTLTVEVAVDNAGGTIQVDSGETLRLNGAAIDGGTVTGNVDVTGNSSINGTSTGTPAVTTDATLVNSTVTVESGVILTLDNVTAIATTITDKGTIVLDDTVKLSDGATIEGVSGSALGAITNNGTLEVAGAAELLDDTVTNGGIIQIDDSQTLTLSGTEIIGGTINDFSGPLGGKVDVTGSSKIDGGATLNNGAVTLESNVTLTLDNVTVTGTTFNDTASGATLSVDLGANLNFAGATVSGGLVNIGGQLDSTGISAITDVSITNTGLIEASSGVLTIDPATALTLTNSGMLEANGGDLDITSELVANTGTLRAIDNSTLKLTTTTVTNSGAGTVTVASGSTLDLASANIDGGTVGNSGAIDNVSGSNTISGLVTNTGIIEVKAGTLDLSGGLSGAGSLIIDAGATLELAGADAQTISFAGGIGTLQLDHALGFTGTIAGTSSTGGTFTITGAGDITSASGDAIDFTASGGVAGNEADVTLTPSGAITGAANGIVVVQNGAGDITVDPSGNVVGHAGDGVIAEDSATGTGNIFVNGGTGSATGTGTGSVGLLAENLNAANAGDITVTQLGGASGALFGIEALTEGNGDVSVEAAGAITAAAQYGIRAASSGTGDITVKTDAGTVINSGGAGIVAVNEASTVPTEADSTIIVTAYGTIDSGTALTVTGSVPAGILAGYLGGDVPPSGFPLTGVNGDVTVNNYADITAAAGDGIRAYNYGIGDVTVNDDAGSIVALGGTSPVNGYGNGISADNFGTGDVNVTTAVGITIESGGSGIVANNAAAAAPSSSEVHVQAHGTITSGQIPTDDGNPAAGILAGYNNNDAAEDNVHGHVVIDDYASITAAAGTDGIRGYNFGAGTITITVEAGADITAGRFGIAAVGFDNGDVSVTNYGTVSAPTAIFAMADETANGTGTGSGTATIDNHGTLTGAVISYNAIFTNESGAVWNLTNGNSLLLGSSEITNLGTIDNGASSVDTLGDGTGDLTLTNNFGAVINATNGTLFLDTGHTIANAGLLEATSGGTLQIDDSVDNTGMLEANGGTLVIGANAVISGSATVTIENGGVADFVGSSAQTLDLNATFSGTGTLVLDHSQHYGGTISGFGSGDTIDLTDLTYSTSETDVWNSATETLTIYDGAHTASLTFAGSYNQNSFALSSDASGDTDVVLAPASASLSGLDGADHAVNGNAVTASLADPQASNITYQWFDDGVAIANATGASYTPTANDLGKVLDVVVGFTDGGTTEQVTALAGTVAAAPAVSFSSDAASTGENTPLTVKSLNVSFADAGSDIIHVTLDVNDGTLSLASSGTVTETGEGTGALTLSGTLAAIDAALGDGIVYTPTVGYVGIDTLSATASDGAFHANTAAVSIDVTPPAVTTVTITVDTPNGLDFEHSNLLAGIGSGTIQPGGDSTSFTIVDTADHLEFVFDGSNFSYGSNENGITVTGGTLTSFHEFTNDATPVPLADFTGLSMSVVTGISDVQLAAGGNDGAIAALISTFAYNFVGGSGPNSFSSAGQADTLSGTGVDVFDGGGAPSGSHDTLTGGAGSTFVFAQGYGALTITNFDQANGTFDATEGDQLQLRGLTAPQNVSYANGNAMLDFGNGDVVTLLHVTQTEYDALGGTEFSTGGSASANLAVVPAAASNPAASTIVASGPNQILTGHAASDSFVFNFTGVGQTAITDFHPATDILEFSNHLFTNLQAALSATHDDGHGNTVIALDAHDTITLDGILKAQLHASDFHFV